MRSRAVRITLTLLAFGALIAAAYLTWSVDNRLFISRKANASFDNAHASAIREAYELRSAQQAYVAAGQSETFWIGKVTAAGDALRAALDTLTSSTQSGAIHTAIEGTAQAVEDFERVDRRVRGYATTGQKLLAADIIFSDGLEASAKILEALSAVRQQSVAETEAAENTARMEWRTALGASAGVVAIALILLTGVPAGETAIIQQPAASARPPLDLDLRPGASRSAPAAKITPPDQPPPKRGPDPAPGLREAELLGLASICSDLARLSDTGSLPAILERAAKALDASGLVLWVVDPDGKELMPVAAHGYPVSVLSRLGSLSVHGENATAAAFRTGLVQTVKGDTDTDGAIAAPLVGSSGCRGVMAAEVRHEGERQPTRLAAASIVAAQLATLIGPPAARVQERNSAAL
jgi:hypothetical protein